MVDCRTVRHQPHRDQSGLRDTASSYLVGQFILLHKRAHLSDGVMRLCGLTPENYRVIKLMQLANRFPNYSDREHAVMGYRPNKPR